MKKFTRFLTAIMFSLLVFFVPFAKTNTASAVSQGSLTSYTQFTAEVNSILSELVKFTKRTPGSEDELKTSNYISNYLKTNTTLKAKTNSYVIDGVQQFEFESDLSGLYENSQNIIYQFNQTDETEKKVILACNYDVVAFQEDENYDYDFVDTEGVNTSAGSVATLLAMAKFLPLSELDFNVEFVFFGAGESSYAGADIYVKGIDDDEKENILCMINFDNIALGQNLYFYVDEINNDFSELVEEVSDDNNLDIRKVGVNHLNKVLDGFYDELGLGYTHIALQGENAKFMKAGIASLNIFAGDYDNGIIVGRNEFDGKETITYTEKDSVEFITKNYGFEKVNENLFEVYKSVVHILTDEEFVETLIDMKDDSNLFYSIFANRTLVVYLTLCAFIIFVVVAMYVHYKLSVKAYHANTEVEFLSSVVKISEEIDKTGVDANVPKVVSQVIAKDIKKDKTIKIKRKKDKK